MNINIRECNNSVLVGISGEAIVPVGETILNFRINERTLPYKCIVGPDRMSISADGILGRDILSDMNAEINFKDKSIKLADFKFNMYNVNHINKMNLVAEVSEKYSDSCNKFKFNQSKSIANTSTTTRVTIFKEVCDDIFNAPSYYSLVNYVSNDVSATRGIAGQFKKKFGRRDLLLKQKRKVGECATLFDNFSERNINRCIYYLVIKQSSRCKPTLMNIRNALLSLKKECFKNSVRYLAMPKLMCKENQIEWHDIQEIIKEIFRDTGMSISFYHKSTLSSYQPTSNELKEPCTKMESNNSQIMTVRLIQKTKIPARSQVSCMATQDITLSNGSVLIEPVEILHHGVVAARTLCNARRKVSVCIMNTTFKSVCLQKNTIVGYSEAVDEKSLKEICHINEIESLERGEPEEPLVGCNFDYLPIEEGGILRELITEYSDLFKVNDVKLGCTEEVQHRIITEDSTPITKSPYRIPFRQREELKNQIDDMIQQGVIRQSKSAWSAPVVMVAKKAGEGENKVRVCIDYRALNNITKRDYFPLPNLQETLDQLGESQYFSTLDLASGYWQVKMDERDIEKTAFSTPDGHYECMRMPFGLVNAPSTFQRLMNITLSGLTSVECLVYLDDIIVFSKTFKEHISHIRNVFDRLRKANLKLKFTKCQFASKEVKYLGHYVSSNGVYPDPEKTEVVKNYPQPKNIKQIRAFLGLVGFYRKFIPEYAHKAQPLTKLTRKNEKFVWKEDQEEAFRYFKKKLTSPPVLSFPNFKKPFVLSTDASGKAIGAVLSQLHGDNEKPIAYASRQLNKAELNYSVTEQECLAVVWAIKTFRCYLYGTKFQVITDHRALSWLLSLKDPTSRLARWAILLSEYDFEIKYRSGKKHNHADALSRIREEEVDKNQIEVSTIKCTKQQEFDKIEIIPYDSKEDPRYPHPIEVNVQIQEYGELSDDNNDSSDEDRKNDVEVEEEREKQSKFITQQPSKQEIFTTKEEEKNDVAYVPMLTKCEIQREQIADEELKKIINKINNDENVRDYYLDEDDLLIKKSNSEEVDDRVVIPKSLVKEIIKNFHDLPFVGHMGVSKTYNLLKDRVYWENMSQDIKDYIKKCISCNERKTSPHHRKAPLQKFQPANYPLELVAMDIVGPLVTSNDGNKYILTVQDYFTKYLEAIPLPNQKTETIAKAFVTNIICRHGVPKKLLTDQGANIISKLMKEICRLLGVTKIQTTAYHPQSNGMIERSHRVIKDVLSHFVDRSQRDWSDWLPYTMMAYRATYHSSTGKTPYYLMHGREMGLPSDDVFKAKMRYNYDDDYSAEMVARLNIAFEQVRSTLEKTAKVREKYYNKKTSDPKIAVGQRVFLYNPAVGQGRSRKLSKLWKGPYLVVEQLGPVTFRIINERGTDEQIVHVNRLKRYQDDINYDVEGISRRRRKEEKEEDEEKDEEESEYENEQEFQPQVERLRGLKHNEGYYPLIAPPITPEPEVEETTTDADSSEEETTAPRYQTRSRGPVTNYPWVMPRKL